MYGYSNYRPPQKKKKNSGSAIAIAIGFLVIAIVSLLCALIYMKVIDGYEKKIEECEELIRESKSSLKRYERDITELHINLNALLAESESENPDESEDESVSGNESESDSADELLNQHTNISNYESDTFNIPEVANKVAPAVIGIKVHVPAQSNNSFWQTSALESSGSGIILTANGFIVTNYHVVEYAVAYQNTIITAVLSDGSEHTANYIGGDEINDLAIIKIEAEDLPYASLGSSDDLRVGDFVIAIGNPLGINLYGSVTFGIISGVKRKMEAENVAEELIQTDAAINPGNSGGALINSSGEVIGINTIKISTSNVEGLGFAIPIDYAKPLIDSLIEHGYIKDRPTLGINGSEISRSLASFYGVPRGILVSGFEEGSNAPGKINLNDIITSIDNQEVFTVSNMTDIVKTHAIGDVVTITVWRNGEYIGVNVEIVEKR